MNKSMPAWLAKWMTINGDIYRQLEGRQTLKISLNNEYYFLKRHHGVGWREIIKNLLQGRLPVVGAKNEYQALRKLAAINVLAPEVKLYAHFGRNPAKCDSVIIMESIEQAISLEDFCQDWKVTPPTYHLKRKLIRAVAKMVSAMHGAGINHRDLYICHFLLKTASLSQTELEIYLIDLHRAQSRSRVPFRWLVKDLAGLYFSAMDIGLSFRDICYFLKYYFGLSVKEIFSQNRKLLNCIQVKAEKLYLKEHGTLCHSKRM